MTMHQKIPAFGPFAAEVKIADALVRARGPAARDDARALLREFDAEATVVEKWTRHLPHWDLAGALRHQQQRDDTAMRIGILEALGQGRAPEPPAPADPALAAAAVVRRFVAECSGRGVAWLVAQAATYIRADEVERAHLTEELGRTVAGHRGRGDGSATIDATIRPWATRLSLLESRLPGRKAALDGFRREFAERSAPAVKALGRHAEIKDLVGPVTDGNLDAYSALLTTVEADPKTFPSGTAERLLGAGAEALVVSGAPTWLGVLTGAVARGPEREFAEPSLT